MVEVMTDKATVEIPAPEGISFEVPAPTRVIVKGASKELVGQIAASIRKIRPLWYIGYSKEEARVFLEREYGWRYYGGHHLENRMTAFLHGIYAPRKFHSDFRNNALSALVRNQEALRPGELPAFRVRRERKRPLASKKNAITRAER